MENKIICLDCDYTGKPNYDDGGNMLYCPECESMYLIVIEEEK